MDEQIDHQNPATEDVLETSPNQSPPLLTVSQAYEHLISSGLPRSKKTIRKWCRLNHVEKKENLIPGGAKWLITRKSLDARVAEERLIDASLTQETGADRSEPVSSQTGTNPSELVRDDELVDVLKEQLGHERNARIAAEDQNNKLLTMYHEISIASTRVGIEIGKGMQEQAKIRREGTENEGSQNGSPKNIRFTEQLNVDTQNIPQPPNGENSFKPDDDGDNSRAQIPYSDIQ